MKHIKKYTITLAIVILAGCSQKNTKPIQTTTPTQPSATEEVTQVFNDDVDTTVVEEYLDAVVAMDFETASKYFKNPVDNSNMKYKNASDAKESLLNYINKNNPELSEFSQSLSEIVDAAFENMLKYCSYEIKESEQSKNQIICKVNLTLPENIDSLYTSLCNIISNYSTEESMKTITENLLNAGTIKPDSSEEEFINAIMAEILNKTKQDISIAEIATQTVEDTVIMTFSDGEWFVEPSSAIAADV